MVVTIVAHPTSIACTKVQAFKRNMATIVLVDVESKLCSSGLAIQGIVQVGHSFEAYRLAKRLTTQWLTVYPPSAFLFVRKRPLGGR
jgi:hypothetical protein